ncbi:MAG: hypothetical protein HXY20_14090, partial [Acidobacteria bacterium]|nr:hypothetical protein [Acidobacteriota bacterium]
MGLIALTAGPTAPQPPTITESREGLLHHPDGGEYHARGGISGIRPAQFRQAGSPAIDAGTDLGAFTPPSEYRHPACGEARITKGPVDIGAYELGGADAPRACR